MHRQVLLGLCIRHAAIPDQPNSLKLELPRKLPTLHDAPPVPLKHLTWCLRNRVQAISSFVVACTFIVSLCRAMLFRIADLSTEGERCFACFGPLSFLRMLDCKRLCSMVS